MCRHPYKVLSFLPLYLAVTVLCSLTSCIWHSWSLAGHRTKAERFSVSACFCDCVVVMETFTSNWSRALISLSSLLAPCFEISVLPSALPSSLLRLPSQPTSAPNSLYLCSPLASATKQRPAEVGTCQLWSFPVTSSCDLIPEWARTAAISVSIQPVIPKPSEPQLCTAKIMTCVCAFVCISIEFHLFSPHFQRSFLCDKPVTSQSVQPQNSHRGLALWKIIALFVA